MAADAERAVFLHGADIVARRKAEHGRIVAAGDGDSHLLGVDAAEAIADLDGEHFIVTLAGLQRLHGTGDAVAAIGQRVGPLAAAVDGD